MTKIHALIVVFSIAALAGAAALVSPSGIAYGSLLPQLETVTQGAPQTVLFTGDVMLARKVEYHMEQDGTNYPFSRLGSLFDDAHVVFNFESAVTEPHQRTPFYTFRFATPHSALQALKDNGFTHASLANNHSFDFGAAGFASTNEALEQVGLVTVGHPRTLTADNITYLTIDGGTLAIVAINVVTAIPSDAELQSVTEEAAEHSDVQVAYVHWGTEYAPTHSRVQERFAKTLASTSIDLIVGHHPHVVQDIQVVNKVPVVYSLGNFVFDQYFSQEVQDGLLLSLRLTKNEMRLELLPVTSIDMQSAPRTMNKDESTRFLSTLAAKSSTELREQIQSGLIVVPR